MGLNKAACLEYTVVKYWNVSCLWNYRQTAVIAIQNVFRKWKVSVFEKLFPHNISSFIWQKHLWDFGFSGGIHAWLDRPANLCSVEITLFLAKLKYSHTFDSFCLSLTLPKYKMGCLKNTYECNSYCRFSNTFGNITFHLSVIPN